MSKDDDNNPGTDGATPDPTDGTPPAATDPKGKPAAIPPSSDDDKVVLSKKDYAKLVGDRDKNFSDKVSVEDRLDYLEGQQAKDAFIRDIRKKYPDVPKALLEQGDSEEAVEEIAETFTATVKKKQQEAVANAQVVNTEPDLTPQDAQKQLDKLEKSDDPRKFEKMVDIQSRIKKN